LTFNVNQSSRITEQLYQAALPPPNGVDQTIVRFVRNNQANPGESKVLILQSPSSPNSFLSIFHLFPALVFIVVFILFFLFVMPSPPLLSAKQEMANSGGGEEVREKVVKWFSSRGRGGGSWLNGGGGDGGWLLIRSRFPIRHLCSLFPHLCPNGQSNSQSNAANWVDKGWRSRQ